MKLKLLAVMLLAVPLYAIIAARKAAQEAKV